RVASGRALVRSKDLDTDLCNTLASDTQLASGMGGQIDDPALDEGATIVDAYFDCAAILQVRHAHDGAEGERSVGRDHRSHIEGVTIRHPAALMVAAIPGSKSCLDEGHLLGGPEHGRSYCGRAGREPAHCEQKDRAAVWHNPEKIPMGTEPLLRRRRSICTN